MFPKPNAEFTPENSLEGAFMKINFREILGQAQFVEINSREILIEAQFAKINSREMSVKKIREN